MMIAPFLLAMLSIVPSLQATNAFNDAYAAAAYEQQQALAAAAAAAALQQQQLFAPANTQVYAPAQAQVYAPAQQQVYAPAQQQVYAPAQQQMYALQQQQALQKQRELQMYAAAAALQAPAALQQQQLYAAAPAQVYAPANINPALQAPAALAFTVVEQQKAQELYLAAQEVGKAPFMKARAVAKYLEAPAVYSALQILDAPAAAEALGKAQKVLVLRAMEEVIAELSRDCPCIDRHLIRKIIMIIRALEAILRHLEHHHHCRGHKERIQIIIIRIVIRKWRESHLLAAEPEFGFGKAPAFDADFGFDRAPAFEAAEEAAPAWGARVAALAKKEIFEPAWGELAAPARAARELLADDYDAKGRVLLTWKDHAKILKKFAEGHSFHGKAFNVNAEACTTVVCHHRRFERRTVALSHVFFPRIEGLFHALCRPHWCIEIRKAGDRCGRSIIVRAKWILHRHVYTDIAVSEDVFAELADRMGQQYADVKFRLAECPLYLAREEAVQ